MANTTRKKTAQDYLLENAARLEKISGKSVHYETGEKEAASGSKKLARAVDGVKTKTADDAMRENAVRLHNISSAQRASERMRQAAEQERRRAAQEVVVQETAAREAAAQNAPTSVFRAGAANQSAALRRLAELAAQNELEREKREVSAPPVMPMARGNTIIGGMYDGEMGMPDIGAPAA